jgi:hypothetical protein
MTYSVRVFVAKGIHHAMRMRQIVICGLPGCTVFFPIASYTARIFFGGWGELSNIKCVFEFSLQLLCKIFSILRKIQRYIVVNVYWSSAAAQWLRCCATNRKVAGSIPDGVIGIFH